jgi:proline racemase
VARSLLRRGKYLVHDSIVGSRFVCGAGSAYRAGSSRFTVDTRDPLVPGFVLR